MKFTNALGFRNAFNGQLFENKIEVENKLVMKGVKPWGSRVRLPAIEDMSIVQSIMDELAKAGDLERVKWRQKDFVMIPCRSNRYLKYYMSMLQKAVDERNRERFDYLVTKGRKSRSLMLYCLGNVERNFYKTHSEKRIVGALKRLERISRGGYHRMKCERWMLNKQDSNERGKWEDFHNSKPKGDGRPLTVPTLEGRAYNHMNYIFGMMGMEATIAPGQHGARPRYGVNTALADLARKATDYQYIGEFDLTKFFDRVNWKLIRKTAQRTGLPERFSNGMFKHIEENEQGLPDTCYGYDRELRLGKRTHQEEMQIKEILERCQDLSKLRSLRLGNNLKAELAKQGSILNGFRRVQDVFGTEGGITQGDGLSPMIACAAFQTAYECLGGTGKNILMYMDDGLIFANTKSELEEEILRLKEAARMVGSVVNEKKSHVVKQGIFERSLKFLGYRGLNKDYNGQAASRKGADLVLPKADLNILYEKMKSNNEGYESGLPKGDDLDYLSHTELALRFQVGNSLLAHGGLNGKKAPEVGKKRLIGKCNSLLDKYIKGENPTLHKVMKVNIFNSSSIIVRELLTRGDAHMLKYGSNKRRTKWTLDLRETRKLKGKRREQRSHDLDDLGRNLKTKSKNTIKDKIHPQTSSSNAGRVREN